MNGVDDFRFHVEKISGSPGANYRMTMEFRIGHQKFGDRKMISGAPPYMSEVDYLIRHATAEFKAAMEQADG